MKGNLLYISDEILKNYGFLKNKKTKNFLEKIFYKINPKQIKKIEGSIFGNQEPSLLDIAQTSMGDCYLLSAISAIVDRSPEFIKEIISEDGNYVYVNLYNYNKVDNNYTLNTYKMDKTMCVDYVESNLGHKSPWVFFIEKAYAIHRYLTDKSSAELSTNMDDIISGGFSYYAFRILLGVETKWIQWNWYNDIKQIFNIASTNLGNNFMIIKLTKENYGEDEYNDWYNSNIEGLYTVWKESLPLYDEDNYYYNDEVLWNIFNYLEEKYLTSSEDDIAEFIAKVNNYSFLNELTEELKAEVFNPQNKHIYQKILEALEQGQLITAATHGQVGKLSKGLCKNHEYTIYDIYERSGTVYLQISNPHARNIQFYNFNKTTQMYEPRPSHHNNLFFNSKYKEEDDKRKQKLGKKQLNFSKYSSVNESYSGLFEIEFSDFIKSFDVIEYTDINKNLHYNNDGGYQQYCQISMMYPKTKLTRKENLIKIFITALLESENLSSLPTIYISNINMIINQGEGELHLYAIAAMALYHYLKSDASEASFIDYVHQFEDEKNKIMPDISNENFLEYLKFKFASHIPKLINKNIQTIPNDNQNEHSHKFV